MSRPRAGDREHAMVGTARLDIHGIKQCLEAFRKDVTRYPTTEEGLMALETQPAGLAGWKGPYVTVKDNRPIVDPWQRSYVYRSPGRNGEDYEVFSTGPSGKEGDADNIWGK